MKELVILLDYVAREQHADGLDTRLVESAMRLKLITDRQNPGKKFTLTSSGCLYLFNHSKKQPGS